MLVESGGADVGVRNGAGEDCVGVARGAENSEVEGAGEVVGWLEGWIERRGGGVGMKEDGELGEGLEDGNGHRCWGAGDGCTGSTRGGRR